METAYSKASRFVKKFGFTLVELIVVITILAILATVGFLALSGYTQEANVSVMKMNARSIYSAISAESALTGNSPRYYVIHDSSAALSSAIVVIDGKSNVLT
ncbi:MAG: type II secretion system protein [Patescibacteria group bacterium]